MPVIKSDVTNQRRQQLGAHENWRYKHGPRREQQIQAKAQPSVGGYPKNMLTLAAFEQHDNSPDEAISPAFPKRLPKSILALAALATIATVGEAAAAQPQTPPYRQRIPRPTPNPVNNPARTPFSAAPSRSASGRLHPTSRPLHQTASRPSGLHTQALSVALVPSPNRIAHAIALSNPALATNRLPATSIHFTQLSLAVTGAIDISDTLRPLFFDYIHNATGYLPTDNNQALAAYYQSIGIHKGIDDALSLFIYDQALQNYLEDKLDFVKTTCEHPGSSRDKHTLAPVMQQLLSVLTEDIDFSVPGAQPTASPLAGHPMPAPVSYSANTFRGLHPFTLGRAKQEALSFLQTTLLESPGFASYSWSQTQQLARALLMSMAPELTAVAEQDPGLHTVRYGSRQWGELRLGLAISQQLGLESHTQSIEALTSLGRAYTRHTVPTAEEIAKALTPDNTQTLSFEETILLQMAHAQGFIDLTALTPQNQATMVKQYGKFIQVAFHREIRLANALAQLEKPMPLRSTIAADILRKAGYDPEQKIRRHITALGYDGRTHITWSKLIDVYRDYHIGVPVPSYLDPTYTDLFKRLPVLNDVFNTAFDTYQRDSVRAVADLLQVQLEPQIAYMSSAPVVTSLEASMNLNGIVKHGNTFLSIQDSTAIQYFYIQSDWKLQRLPSTVTTVESLKAWINDNLSAIFHEDRINTFFNLNLQQKAVDALHVDIQQTGDLAGVTTALAEQYVDHTIGQLKNEAYQMGPAEEGRELMHSTFIPFYSMVQNIRNKNYGEALFDGLMDLSGFIPAFGQAARLGTTTAKIASKVAATTITRLVTQGGIRNAVRAGVSTVSKTQLKQIGTQTGKLAWALLDGASPIPLPTLSSGKVKAIKPQQLNEIAKELKPVHPGLSKHIETVAQQHIATHNNKWVSTQASIVHARVEHNHNFYQSTQIINGRTYTIAQLGDQTQVFFKKHKAQDGTEYVTQVNPLSDESYGLHYYLSSKNKIYLTDKAADSLLKEYRATPAIMQRYPVLENSQGHHIVDLNMGAPVYLTHQENIFHILLNKKNYLMQRDERGMTFIIHPDKPEANILIEAADKKWRLPMDETPHEFQEIEKGHSQSWTHPLTREKLIVTRLMDQDRVVALKHKGGNYHEVNWATGESYHQRPLISKQADGQFAQASLKGGMKEGDDLPGPSHSKSTAPKKTTQPDRDIARYQQQLNILMEQKKSPDFLNGREKYKEINVWGYKKNMSILDMKKLFLNDRSGLDLRQKGALSRLIDDAYTGKLLVKVAALQQSFDKAELKLLFPQDFIQNLMGIKGREGFCKLWVTLIMPTLSEGNAAINARVGQLFKLAARPNDAVIKKFISGLAGLEIAKPISDPKYLPVQDIIQNLSASDQTRIFALNTEIHAMAVAVQLSGQKKTFYFLDPNIGVFGFTDKDAFSKALNAYFGDRHLLKLYQPYYENKKVLFKKQAQFELSELDQGQLANLQIAHEGSMKNWLQEIDHSLDQMPIASRTEIQNQADVAKPGKSVASQSAANSRATALSTEPKAQFRTNSASETVKQRPPVGGIKASADIKSFEPVSEQLLLPEQGFVLIKMKDGTISKVDGIHNHLPLDQQLLKKGYDYLDDGELQSFSVLQSLSVLEGAKLKKNLFDINKIETWTQTQQKIDEIFYPKRKHGLLKKNNGWFDTRAVYGSEVKNLMTPDQYDQKLLRRIGGEPYEIKYGIDQGLHVMQQGTVHSCSYTAAAMVLLDLGSDIQDDLFLCVLSVRSGTFLEDFTEEIMQQYQLAGELIRFTHINEWKDRLKDHVGILGIAGHDVVVNRGSDSRHILLRDPYEGKLVEIDIESIQQRFDKGTVNHEVWLTPLKREKLAQPALAEDIEVSHL